MISITNYSKHVNQKHIKSLPAMLKEGHAFFLEAQHLYNEDQVIRESLDLYLEKVNEHLSKEKLNTVDHRKSKNKYVKDRSFIHRFVDLHNKVSTKQQIGLYIKALQQAIVLKKIQKSSPFANHIEQIQKKVINRYNILPENGSVKININKQWLAELKEILNGQPSLKDYLGGIDQTAVSDFPLKMRRPKKESLFNSMNDIDQEPSVNSFQLPGDLGKLLGDLERFELAITLEGDQGGGKTRFSYLLANTFALIDSKVAIFSLEIGRKSDLVRRMREEYLDVVNRDKIFITDQLPQGFDTIRKAAKDFDVIIIDSWNKLHVKSSEFDSLRKEFPNTIFIIIFQRTTQGTIRGGTAPLFDAGINLEVVKEDNTFSNNYAVATKNRYGVTGIKYNITQQKIIEKFEEPKN